MEPFALSLEPEVQAVTTRSALTRTLNFAFHAASAVAKPLLRSRHENVSVEKDVSYGSSDHQLCDIYRPTDAAKGKLPVVLYLHGGGFSICSKESHWVFGAEYARKGYLCVVPDYRLAPEHKFPAAFEDSALAWLWLLDNAERLNADLGRVIIAGESAGANLTMALTLCLVEPRPEPIARTVFERNVVPRAIVAGCGLYRFTNALQLSNSTGIVRSRIRTIVGGYVGGVKFQSEREAELVEVLRAFANGGRFAKPFPATFVPVGGKDIVLKESETLAETLSRCGIHNRLIVYPGQGHSFHAKVFAAPARKCWEDTHTFLDEVLASKASQAA